jgi:hypothetical protein
VRSLTPISLCFQIFRKAVFVISNLTASVSVAAEIPKDLGVLTPFYRSTQLQGHLIGMGLMQIPDYLMGNDIDLKYKRNPNLKKEIPFADSFSINRFLGGYRKDWLKKFNEWDPRLGMRSLDYVTKKNDGSLKYRPDLIKRRLAPYLNAGYHPVNITIALENIPWDVASKRDSTRSAGPWGQNSPPENLHEWSTVIGHFATDLKAYLGREASEIKFKTGVEYDERVSFDGTADQFYAYYATTERALHAVLPRAAFGPGEFTARGTCLPRNTWCVYDSAEFLRYASANHLAVDDVPRSLQSFLDKGNTMPSATAQRAMVSYARLPPVVKEIHQFGILNQPFGKRDGSDPGALQAAWEFQTLMRLWETLKPRRVYHWGGIVQVGKKLAFLTGAGFLRLVLDRYVGSHSYLFGTQDPWAAGVTSSSEVMAVGFTGPRRSAVVVSSYSPMPSSASRDVTIRIPYSFLNGRLLRTIAFKTTNNVFMAIRKDLQKRGNLKPQFANCGYCLGFPLSMAIDVNRGRVMLLNGWDRYVVDMKSNLRWNTSDPSVSLNGQLLKAKLEANELLVIEAR